MINRTIIYLILWPLLALTVAYCGVKGDPLPPEHAADLGHGHSNYQRTTAKPEEKAAKNVKKNNEDEENDDDKNDDKNEDKNDE